MKSIIITACFCVMTYLLPAQDQIPSEIPNVKSYKMVSKSINGGPGSLATNENFGRGVANIGDLNNDGIEDVAIGAPNYAGGGVNRGAVYICFMNADGSVKSSPAISIIKYTANILPLNDNDYFGISVTGIGDLNGDGNEDIAVGAYGTNTNMGAVYIVFLTSSGAMLGTPIKITNSSGGFSGTLSASGQFGMSVANIGDVNHDGKNDIAVGAPAKNSSEGQIWVLRLRGNGQVKSTAREISEGVNFDGTLLEGLDEFGYSITGAGDLNRDGTNDLVVGVPGEDDGYADAGAFMVVYLDTTSAALDVKKLSYPLMTNYYYPNSTNVSLGRSVGISDINEDGLPDILAGVRSFNSNKGGFYAMLLDSLQNITDIKLIGFQYGWSYTGPSAAAPQFGAAICEINTDGDPARKQYLVGAHLHKEGTGGEGSFYVLNMDSLMLQVSPGGIADYVKISDFSGNFTGTLANNCFFGIDATPIGDINNDGNIDIAVGAHGDNTGANGAGAVWILLLDSQGKVSSYQKINSGGSFATLNTNHNFGVGLGPAGDFDNDGVEDILAGAIGDDTGGGDNGAVYLIYLNSNGTIKSYNKIAHSTTPANDIPVTSFFGQDVDTIGDLDGNGVVDLVVGAPRNDDGGTAGNNSNRGAVHIIYMRSNGTVKMGRRISDTQGSFSETFADGMSFGVSVDGIGDFNGDGIPDIAVGASAANNTGATYIIYLDTNATVKGYKKINYVSGNFPYPINTSTAFGGSLQMIDDMDGNGVRDLLVGHHGYKTFGVAARGGAWLTFLDSSANVIGAQVITDSTGFHTNLNETYAFGQCVRYMGHDSLGNLQLLAGGRDDDGGTDRGSVFKMTMASLPYSTFVNVNYNNSGYCQLARKLGGNFYYLNKTRKLRFRTEGEYTTHIPDWKIYNDQHNVVASSATVATYKNMFTNNKYEMTGENFFEITVPCSLNKGYYILETTNEKNEKRYLRFYVLMYPCIDVVSPR